MTLTERAEAAYGQLTPAELQIWNYIYAHQRQCAGMGIEQLAKACLSSKAAVNRFLKKLGYEGYADFKAGLRRERQETQTGRALVKEHYFSLQNYLKYLLQSDFSEAERRMRAAGQIFVYGTGEIQRHAAEELRRSMLYLGLSLHVLEAFPRFLRAAETLEAGDVLILFSWSGDHPKLETAVTNLRKKGIWVMSVTRMEPNPLMMASDFHCWIPSEICQGTGMDLPYHNLYGFFLFVDFMTMKLLEMQAK